MRSKGKCRRPGWRSLHEARTWRAITCRRMWPSLAERDRPVTIARSNYCGTNDDESTITKSPRQCLLRSAFRLIPQISRRIHSEPPSSTQRALSALALPFCNVLPNPRAAHCIYHEVSSRNRRSCSAMVSLWAPSPTRTNLQSTSSNKVRTCNRCVADNGARHMWATQTSRRKLREIRERTPKKSWTFPNLAGVCCGNGVKHESKSAACNSCQHDMQRVLLCFQTNMYQQAPCLENKNSTREACGAQHKLRSWGHHHETNSSERSRTLL